MQTALESGELDEEGGVGVGVQWIKTRRRGKGLKVA